MPPDGAREQVCNSQNISVVHLMINNHVIGDARHVDRYQAALHVLPAACVLGSLPVLLGNAVI